jgi:hypothetical protein
MRRWKLIGIFVLLGSLMGRGDCADLKNFSPSYTTESLFHPVAAHKKKGRKKKKFPKRKNQQSNSKKHYNSITKTEKLLENYATEGKCNRLACSSNIKRAKSCLKTKSQRNQHKKCFRAFCQYGCNDIDYHANPEVFGLCNSICSSRKYQHE